MKRSRARAAGPRTFGNRRPIRYRRREADGSSGDRTCGSSMQFVPDARLARARFDRGTTGAQPPVGHPRYGIDVLALWGPGVAPSFCMAPLGAWPLAPRPVIPGGLYAPVFRKLVG